MKPIERTITAKASKELVIDEIRQLPEGKWTVKIYPWAQKRTTAQNRLVWKWNKEIGDHFGWEDEVAHEFFKEKFLLRIRYRDDPDFARMADIIAKMRPEKSKFNIVKSLIGRIRKAFGRDPEFKTFEQILFGGNSSDDYNFARQWVIREVSTTKLNAVQMAEYLGKMKRFAHEHGANITIPPDKELKWLCGIK